MKNLFKLMLLPLSLLAVACSSDDDGYNADTAISLYNPVPESYRVVKGIKMSATDGRGEHTWNYTLNYDAQRRIKSLDAEISTYQLRNNSRWYRVNIKSSTEYQFLDEKNLGVIYNASLEYPTYPDWNTTKGYRLPGEFNAKGALVHFGTFDCEYSGNTLAKAYIDNGRVYKPAHDRYGNVTGYMCEDGDSIYSKLNIYPYSSINNKTNVDFSGFMGYWVPEREIYDNHDWRYAFCHLAAFDMLGARSLHLPEGEWTLDASGCPVACVLPSGIRLEIVYAE